MDLLIVEPVEPEVSRWISSRHNVRIAPELARDPRAFRRALHDVRALIIPASVTLDAKALRHAPLLQVVGRITAGAENIDFEACARAEVELVRGSSATAQAEAEFMVCALLTLLRRVPVMGLDGLRLGRELGACTVGLVGMTQPADKLAQLLQAFGAQVVGYDPSVHANDSAWERRKVRPLGLCELLEQADAVCVQLNYFSRYHGLLGERFLPCCKRDQVIVSIAHSALFDEFALADVLRTGRVAAAWMDSLEPGALDPGRPLAGIETLQVTPRVASTTRESRLRATWDVMRRIDEVLAAGESGPNAFKPTEPNVAFGP
jgi:phosphoglycerate dehydrogenase-like enzyme